MNCSQNGSRTHKQIWYNAVKANLLLQSEIQTLAIKINVFIAANESQFKNGEPVKALKWNEFK